MKPIIPLLKLIAKEIKANNEIATLLEDKDKRNKNKMTLLVMPL